MDIVSLAAANASAAKKYTTKQQHNTVAPLATVGQYSSGRVTCGVDATSGKVWSYSSGGLYQVDSLTATNWSAVTLPANCTLSGQAAKVVVWTPPGGGQPLMYAMLWNSTASAYQCYSAPLVPKGTAPTWTGPLFSYATNATLIPTAFRGTSTGLYAGEYTGVADIAGGPTIHRWDGTTHTAALGPLAGARHIHAVYEDPFNPGTLYATIGDYFSPYTPPAALYKSVGGANFTAVPGFASGTVQAVSMGFTADHIWCLSDQSQGGGPFVIDRNTLAWKWATLRGRHDRIPVPGGVGGRVLTDVSFTTGSTTITSASANFTSFDVGKYVNGNNGIPLGHYIVSVTNSTTAVLSVAMTSTQTNQTLVISGDVFYANAYAGGTDPATGWLYVVANDTSNAGNTAGVFVLTGLDKPFTLLWTMQALTSIGNAEVFIAGGYLWFHRYGPIPLLTAA